MSCWGCSASGPVLDPEAELPMRQQTERACAQSSIHKRPEQVSTLSVECLGSAEVVEVTRKIPDEQPTVRQGARPVIEPGLERSRTLMRLDAPVPDLDLFLYLQ